MRQKSSTMKTIMMFTVSCPAVPRGTNVSGTSSNTDTIQQAKEVPNDAHSYPWNKQTMFTVEDKKNNYLYRRRGRVYCIDYGNAIVIVLALVDWLLYLFTLYFGSIHISVRPNLGIGISIRAEIFFAET